MDLISNLASGSGWVYYADTDHHDLLRESLALGLAKFSDNLKSVEESSIKMGTIFFSLVAPSASGHTVNQCPR